MAVHVSGKNNVLVGGDEDLSESGHPRLETTCKRL